MDIEALIPNLAALLGVEPATALLLFGLVVTTANLTGRVIPDDATGFLGGVRKVAKLVGLYLGNRVTKNLSVNDVAISVVEKTSIADEAAGIIPAFPNLPVRDPSTGKFMPKDSGHE